MLEKLYELEILQAKYAEVCGELARLKIDTEALRAVARGHGFTFNDNETVEGFCLNLMTIVKSSREFIEDKTG